MYNGILNIYKEKDFTSFDVVAKLRGICGQKKIGHTGTLDPQAEGVLPVCLGKATKICELLTDQHKEYETVLRLGQTSDTQDAFGAILSEMPTGHLATDEVLRVIYGFLGKSQQTPPMYSAKRVGGQHLYDLARQGIEVERKASEIEIFAIEILEMELPCVRMRVECSKGTYIRTLCHDIGEKLGCGGLMTELTRTRVGDFDMKEAYTLGKIEQLCRADRLTDALIPIDRVFRDDPAVYVPETLDPVLANGGKIAADRLSADAERIRMYRTDGTFAAVYRKENELYRPLKMFL